MTIKESFNWLFTSREHVEIAHHYLDESKATLAEISEWQPSRAAAEATRDQRIQDYIKACREAAGKARELAKVLADNHYDPTPVVALEYVLQHLKPHNEIMDAWEVCDILGEKIQLTPTTPPAQNPAESVEPDEDHSFYPPAYLAEKFPPVDPENARKALEAWRRQNTLSKGYIENEDAGGNVPRFTYRLMEVRGVMEHLQKLAERRDLRRKTRKNSSGKLPAVLD